MNHFILNRVRHLAMLVMAFLSACLVLSGMNANTALAAPSQQGPAYAPTTVAFEGYLADSGGNALSGTYSLKFRLYEAVTGGTALWTEEHTSVNVSHGLYSVQLGSVTSLPSDAFGGDRWLSVQINSNAEMSPRIPITAVPWALNATQAQGLQGNAVSSSAPSNNQALIWNASASEWQPQNLPQTGDAVSIQGRSVDATLPANGQVLVWNNSISKWQPQSPAESGNATQIQSRAVSNTAPSIGQLLGWDGMNWIPTTISSVASADHATTAGTADSANALQGSAVASTAPASGQVLIWNSSSSQWEPAAVSASQIQGNTISAATPTSGQALVWNGTTWTPTTISSVASADHATTAGTADSANALQGSAIASTAPASGQALVWNGTTWTPTTISSVASADHATTAGTADSANALQGSAVASTTPTSGQALVWNGTSWAPSAVNAVQLQSRAVSSTAPSSGQMLGWNGTNWIPTSLNAGNIQSGLLGRAYGGTGVDLSATGGSGYYLKQSTAGGTITVAPITASDIPNLAASIITSGQLPLARGGTGVDLSSTGGIGYYLKQSTVGGPISVGPISAGDVASGSLSLARGGTGTDLSSTGPGWLRQASSGASITVTTPKLSDLSDVSATPPTSGQTLTWNGALWSPNTPVTGASTFPDLQPVGNNASPQNFLATYRSGAILTYKDASTVSVSAGQLMIDGYMRSNSSMTDVGFTNSGLNLGLDTGSATSNTKYYVYAVADNSSMSTFELSVSASGTSPLNKTHSRKLGWFQTGTSNTNFQVGSVGNVVTTDSNFAIGARVYNSANISASTGDNVLTFNSESLDTDGLHSTSSNTSRLTATVAGKYLISGHVDLTSNCGSGILILSIRLNGSTNIARDSTAWCWNQSLTTIYPLAVNDYVELVVNLPSSKTVAAAPNYSPLLSMVRIGD